jgi:hypothetical protein
LSDPVDSEIIFRKIELNVLSLPVSSAFFLSCTVYASASGSGITCCTSRSTRASSAYGRSRTQRMSSACSFSQSTEVVISLENWQSLSRTARSVPPTRLDDRRPEAGRVSGCFGYASNTTSAFSQISPHPAGRQHGIAVSLLPAPVWSCEVGFFAVFWASFHAWFLDLYYNTGAIDALLCYAFFFAALALYLNARRSEKPLNARQMAGLLVLYICALNAKEMAVQARPYTPPANNKWRKTWHNPTRLARPMTNRRRGPPGGEVLNPKRWTAGESPESAGLRGRFAGPHKDGRPIAPQAARADAGAYAQNGRFGRCMSTQAASTLQSATSGATCTSPRFPVSQFTSASFRKTMWRRQSRQKSNRRFPDGSSVPTLMDVRTVGTLHIGTMHAAYCFPFGITSSQQSQYRTLRLTMFRTYHAQSGPTLVFITLGVMVI